MSADTLLVAWQENCPSSARRWIEQLEEERDLRTVRFAAARRSAVLATADDVERARVGTCDLLVAGSMLTRDGRPVRLCDLNGLPEGDEPFQIAQHITARCWGRYLLVIATPESLHVMTDPSGQLQLYRALSKRLAIVSDYLSRELVERLGIKVAVDHAALAQIMLVPSTAVFSSPLAGVEPLLPGALTPLHDRHDGRSVWSPAKFARAAVRPDLREVRRTIEMCCRAAVENRSLMLLSGGLDSAIVLGAMSANRMPAAAVNFVTQAADGDERAYARSAADRASIPLLEKDAGREPDLERLAAAAQGAQPLIFGTDSSFEDAVAGAANDSAATSVTTGQGGDAVFFQPALAEVFLDRLRTAGMAALRPSALFDDAYRGGTSVWTLFRAALLARAHNSWRRRHRFGVDMITDPIRRQLGNVDRLHPWVEEASDLSPGKRIHIMMIADSQIYMTRSALGRAAMRHPLLSQPIIEALVAFPVSALAYGRNDRMFARALFADVLPEVVAKRRTKGSAANHYSRAVAKNLPFLRDYLLDGALVQAGLLDRSALDRSLSLEHLFYSNEYPVFIMQVSCEAWLRSWS